MKNIITVLFLFSLSYSAIAQENTGSRILSKEDVEQLFPDNVKETFKIQYPIRRVYSYADASGDYLMALTESVDQVVEGDTLHHRIKAFHFKRRDDKLEKVREINDFIIDEEASLWFWTRYSLFTDIDEDGLVDPIVIYGTRPENLDSFRVRILIYYKNKKYAIRHHNCNLDFCRFTQIDKDFYSLPQPIIKRIKRIMNEIEQNNHAYFGHWEEAMKNRKEKF